MILAQIKKVKYKYIGTPAGLYHGVQHEITVFEIPIDIKEY